MDLINMINLESVPQTSIAWILVLIVGIIFVTISAILVYHWRRYGLHKNTTRTVMTVYFGVALVLWYSIIISALTITNR